MSARHSPADEAEAAAMVREAHAGAGALRVEGGNTAEGLGRPVETGGVISVARLSGVLMHEPAELFISARAGTPVRDVEAALAAKNQMLPFEPLDLRPLYGSAGEPTVGGLVAGNWSGPRRIAAGAARDHVIGVRFVNGLGEVVKSGGRVMKNVTGLDLAKLMCGAHGTLGLLTEVTFKVLPRPERGATLQLSGLDDNRAAQALSAALGSPFEVTGAAHLPDGTGGAPARTLLRLEGFSASVDYRLGRLSELLRPFGQAAVLETGEADALWCDIRDVRFLAEPREAALWRLSTAPTRGPSLAALIGRARPARCIYDWGGGLLWVSTGPEDDGGAAAIREALAVTGGHATLVRAPAALRGRIDVFQPLSPALRALTERIKRSLDPRAVLNPGRMYAGC